MTAIAIAINVANASYQNEFFLFSLRSRYGKFVVISIDTFLKVFQVREFFCLLKFNEFKERAFSSKLTFFFFSIPV